MLSMLTLISSSGMLEFGEINDFMLVAVKYMFVIGGFIYLLFAYLVTKQISLMSRTISTTASAKNKTLGYVHLVVSVVVLIYFLLVL